MRRHHQIWGFPEENKPCGETGLILRTPWDRRTRDCTNHIMVSRPATHPWFIILWEPLPHYLPSPSLAMAYCCYVRTIIFYARPYQIDPFSRLWDNYTQVTPRNRQCLKFAQLDSSLQIDDVVEWEGELFGVGPGRVVYKNRRWWVMQWARKKEKRF